MPRRALVVAVLAAALLVPPGSASARESTVTAARKCKLVIIHNRLGAAASHVYWVRRMSCRRARAVLRRHGGSKGRRAHRVGGRFRMGKFRCRVTSVSYESRTALCRRGARRFRVGYGS
jgi:hypothetical protein